MANVLVDMILQMKSLENMFAFLRAIHTNGSAMLGLLIPSMVSTRLLLYSRLVNYDRLCRFMRNVYIDLVEERQT